MPLADLADTWRKMASAVSGNKSHWRYDLLPRQTSDVCWLKGLRKHMTTLPFDTQNIRWNKIEGIEHLAYHILAVDEAKRIVDILFKFDANAKIVLHRHKADYITFVLQGELRIYRPNGTLKEIRPVGSYVTGSADGEPHTEGGGEQDVIAFFSNRNVQNVVYEILDESLNTIATFGIAEFKALLDAQVPQPTTIVS
ncbi:MAG: regulator [Hyphomicrobium sp.]